MASNDPAYYVQGVLNQDKRIVAKAITLIESALTGHQEIARRVIHELLPYTGNAIRLGLNFDSMGAVKSYPLDLQPFLAQSLLALGFDLFLFGTAPVCQEVPVAHTHLHDLTGKTSILELAALLEQMDFVLAADSFVAHLAALLRKKTMVLLSTTGDAYFKHYTHVRALNSKMPCAPCFQTGDQCPQGLSHCGAFYDPSLHPDKIASRTIQEITAQYKRRLMR